MDDEPLIPRASVALLALVFLGAFVRVPASAKEVPKIPIPTKTATVAPLPTSTPTPTASPVPTLTPTPTNTPTPDPNDVEYWTTMWTIDRVMLWRGEIERIVEAEGFEDVTVPLVMAVIAEESAGDINAVSSAGACSLMQVIPQPWLELSASAICNSGVGSIYQGSYILQWSIDLGQKEELDIYHQIGFYNCSYEGVMNDRCGSRGGIWYSHRVIDYWLPLFLERLAIPCDGQFCE